MFVSSSIPIELLLDMIEDYLTLDFNEGGDSPNEAEKTEVLDGQLSFFNILSDVFIDAYVDGANDTTNFKKETITP